jgi:phosphate/sulfate permease
MTNGMKSSEFQLAVATVISVLLADILGMELSTETIMGVIGAVSSFAISRGLAKTENK